MHEEKILDNRELTIKFWNWRKDLRNLKERNPRGRTEDDEVPRKTHGIGETDSP